MIKFTIPFLLGFLCFSTNAQDTKKKKEPVIESLQYRSVGPTRGGRVTTVCGIDSIESTFYMGATGGGVWKTENHGNTWQNVSDGYFATPSIGSIAVYQKKSDIVYVGTGSDAIRSNVIVGKGMYKTEDAGKTWSHIGLEKAGQIGAVIIHPDDPNQVYVAVQGQPFRKSQERGVYKTVDGGHNWQPILTHSDSVGAVDLEFAPDNPNIVYACMYRTVRKPWTIISGGATDGIYKSEDAGETWKKLEEGLPHGMIGKIDLAVSPDNPARVWAQVQAENNQGVYKSDDYGETWVFVKVPKKTQSELNYRPWYFTNMHCDPSDADHILAGSWGVVESFDAGETWSKIKTTHGDHHDLWINPLNSKVLIEGNDGGAAVSIDGGKNWSSILNQPTAEMYSCNVDDHEPYYIYSGQQDNSTIRVPNRRPRQNAIGGDRLADNMFWERVGGCETGPVIPKPGDPNTIYTNCKGKFSVYHHDTGIEKNYFIGAENIYGSHPDQIKYRLQRVTPFEVSPHNPNQLYYGSQFLHETKDGGVNWNVISPDLTANVEEYRMRSGGPIENDITGEEYYAVIYAIQESPLQQGLIWTGSNDGLFQITQNGGKDWKDVTPDMPTGGRISQIEVSPHQAGKAYFAVYRDYLGDDTPYFYKTEDFGGTWELISGPDSGIPQDQVARVLREDTEREGLLFAGTEFGMYISFDDGDNWQSFQKNLPVVPVTDMRIHQGDLVLSTLGRSFWVMDDIEPLRHMDTANSEFTLYKPKHVESEGLNIYFKVPSETKEEKIQFDIYKGKKLVHSKWEPISKHQPDEFGIRKTVWDMRHYFKNGEKDFRGPMVTPGSYTLKVKFGKEKVSKDFHIKMSSRVADAGTSIADLMEQEALAVKVGSLLMQLENEIKELDKKLKKAKNDEQKQKIQNKLALLKKGPKSYDKPMLKDQVRYLYRMISKTPQKLGNHAFERYKELKISADNYFNIKA